MNKPTPDLNAALRGLAAREAVTSAGATQAPAPALPWHPRTTLPANGEPVAAWISGESRPIAGVYRAPLRADSIGIVATARDEAAWAWSAVVCWASCVVPSLKTAVKE